MNFPSTTYSETNSSSYRVKRHPFFFSDCAVPYGAVMIIKGGGNDKILHEVAPESHADSNESGRAYETLDVDA